jgi:hypothetical protein
VRLSFSNDTPEGQTEAQFVRFHKDRLWERLSEAARETAQRGEAALDRSDPLVRIGIEFGCDGRVLRDGCAVFHIARQAPAHPEWASGIVSEIEALRAGIRTEHNQPLRFVIWAGVGGSVEDKCMYAAAGLLRRGPRSYILDSADPAKLRNILEDIERRHALSITSILRSTLVAGLATGMTSYEPVVNLEKLYNLYERYRIDSRPNFLYMAPRGSLLERFGEERGCRRVEWQLDGGNSLAGRHSAPLTRGSLYPLALARQDLASWMEGANLSREDVSTAWRLASFINAQGLAGRDKLTLLLPKAWAGAGIWTKQNFEQSLGKSADLGLKVVLPTKTRLADLRSPRDPAQDRAFLVVQVKGLEGPDSRKVAAARRAGYPVAVLTLPRATPLSRYMQFIHYAVFGVAWLRGMNFASEPGGELYKEIAQRLYSEAQAAGGMERTRAWQSMLRCERQACHRGLVTLRYDRLPFDPCAADSAPELYASILRRLVSEKQVEYGELTYFGDTRYSARGMAIRRRLERAAERLFAERLKMPADVYEGPAMNHTYHEMIIGHGKCFSTVLLSESVDQYPAARYSPDYHLAQFLATQMALSERGRPVVSVTLRDTGDESLRALEDFFHRAAQALKARVV